MDSLEPKLICQILSHLPLADAINCKDVCKHWNAAIADHRVTSLRVEACFDANYKWFHSDRPASECESIHPDLFAAHLDNEIFADLKHLSIADRPSDLELNKLNQFGQLVQLELHDCLVQYEHLTLQLPRLEVLYLGYNNKEANISIDAPNLVALGYLEAEYKDLLEVVEPATVRRLHTNLSGERLARFQHVERITTVDCSPLVESTLTDLELLNEIRVEKDVVRLIRKGLKEQLELFMSRKKELEKQLDVVFCGVRLDDQTEYVFEPADQFYMANYERLVDRLPFVHNFNYSLLMQFFKGELPADFHTKFDRLTGVKAEGSIDGQHFVSFLESLQSSLLQLSVQNTGCDQSFYDRLAAFDQIEVFYLSSELELSFEFITKWPRLVVLQISQSLTPRSLRSLLDALRALRPPVGRNAKYNFTSYDQKPFEIQTKEGSSSYALTQKIEFKEFYELDTLLAWLEPKRPVKNGFWRRLLKKLKKGKRNGDS